LRPEEEEEPEWDEDGLLFDPEERRLSQLHDPSAFRRESSTSPLPSAKWFESAPSPAAVDGSNAPLSWINHSLAQLSVSSEPLVLATEDDAQVSRTAGVLTELLTRYVDTLGKLELAHQTIATTDRSHAKLSAEHGRIEASNTRAGERIEKLLQKVRLLEEKQTDLERDKKAALVSAKKASVDGGTKEKQQQVQLRRVTQEANELRQSLQKANVPPPPVKGRVKRAPRSPSGKKTSSPRPCPLSVSATEGLGDLGFVLGAMKDENSNLKKKVEKLQAEAEAREKPSAWAENENSPTSLPLAQGRKGEKKGDKSFPVTSRRIPAPILRLPKAGRSISPCGRSPLSPQATNQGQEAATDPIIHQLDPISIEKATRESRNLQFEELDRKMEKLHESDQANQARESLQASQEAEADELPDEENNTEQYKNWPSSEKLRKFHRKFRKFQRQQAATDNPSCKACTVM